MRLLRSGEGIVTYPDPCACPIRIPAEEQVAIAVEGSEKRDRLRIRSRATLVEARRIDGVAARERGRDLAADVLARIRRVSNVAQIARRIGLGADCVDGHFVIRLEAGECGRSEQARDN